MIRTEHLTKRFGPLLAVEDLNLHVERGEVFGFLGPNGAGKTTTLRMLAALIAPTSGAAWINDRRVGQDDEAIHASIGLLTETPGLYPRLSAKENLSFFAKLHGVEDIPGQVRKYLTLLELWERRSEPVGGFSKGMQQKLAIARALLHEPPVLFLDEPTSALDPEAARLVRDFIETLKGEGRTIFLCTHNLEEASRLSDRVCIINRKIIRIATLSELQNSDKNKRVEIVFKDSAFRYTGLLKEFREIKDIQTDNNRVLALIEKPEITNPLIIKKLIDNGAGIIYFNEIKTTLEEIYLDLIKNEEEK